MVDKAKDVSRSTIRQKKPYAVVAFDTMSDAMAMESAAALYDIPGRVIPVPSEINAGCGMSWAVPYDQREELERAICAHSLSREGIYRVDLF